jgi:hypothetical protein
MLTMYFHSLRDFWRCSRKACASPAFQNSATVKTSNLCSDRCGGH